MCDCGNTVETKYIMDIEYCLKILKGYRIFTGKCKENVSFLMKPCHRQIEKNIIIIIMKQLLSQNVRLNMHAWFTPQH